MKTLMAKTKEQSTRAFRLTVLYAAIASATGVSAVVQAQNELELEEVVVTAQKRTQTLQEVPISVAILSGERFDSAK